MQAFFFFKVDGLFLVLFFLSKNLLLREVINFFFVSTFTLRKLLDHVPL